MSVPGFIAAAVRKLQAGGASSPQRGNPAWMPGVTSPFFNEFPGSINLGTSQSNRMTATVSDGGATIFRCYFVPLAGAGNPPFGVTNYKYVVYANIVSHQEGASPGAGVRGLYLAYFSVDSAGTIIADGDDQSMLAISAAFSVSAVASGNALDVRIASSGSPAGALHCTVYSSTIGRKVGTVSGGG